LNKTPDIVLHLQGNPWSLKSLILGGIDLALSLVLSLALSLILRIERGKPSEPQ
jgi:hypothetical protein